MDINSAVFNKIGPHLKNTNRIYSPKKNSININSNDIDESYFSKIFSPSKQKIYLKIDLNFIEMSRKSIITLINDANINPNAKVEIFEKIQNYYIDLLDKVDKNKLSNHVINDIVAKIDSFNQEIEKSLQQEYENINFKKKKLFA